jgi:hypothetical protein
MDRIEELHGSRIRISEMHICSYANPYAVMSHVRIRSLIQYII